MQETKAGGNAGFFVARHAREGGHPITVVPAKAATHTPCRI
jgi:hypothetical protein